jgi:hypothetical protein
LKNNDFLDEQVESLILEDKFDEEIISLLKYFSEKTDDYLSDNINTLSVLYSDFEENKKKLINI